MILSSDNLVSLAIAVIGGLGAGIGPLLAVLVNVVLTKRGDERLKELQRSAAINLRLTEETHTVLNGPTAERKRLIAKLSRRIADENPGDKDAQLTATFAERDVETGG